MQEKFNLYLGYKKNSKWFNNFHGIIYDTIFPKKIVTDKIAVYIPCIGKMRKVHSRILDSCTWLSPFP